MISQHFTIQFLAEGVHAVIARDGGYAIGNCGVVDLGDRTVIFDTTMTPTAAKDLREAALALTGRPVDLVINSHYHNDHVWGNQVFTPDTMILSSTQTRQLMETTGQEEYHYFTANASSKLTSLKQQQQETTDPEKLADLIVWLGYYEGIVTDLPILIPQLPQVTIKGNCSLHGSQRSAELIHFAGGHTASDLVLHLPQDKIVFMSDLLFVHCHPYLGECDPHKLLTILQEIDQLGAQTFVPGHGPVGGRSDLQQMGNYVEDCLAIARHLVSEATPDENINNIPIPETYRSWRFPQFFLENIRSFVHLVRQ